MHIHVACYEIVWVSSHVLVLALARVCRTDLHVRLVLFVVSDLAHMFDATQVHRLREMLTTNLL